MLNNFLHDLGASGWLFGSLLLWSVLRKEIHVGAAHQVVADLLKTVMRFMRYSLAAIVVFGVVRALAYKEYEWNSVAGQDQVTLLIVKHIILVLIFVWGLVCYLRARNLAGKAMVE
jgi:uncharacterized membrane protein